MERAYAYNLEFDNSRRKALLRMLPILRNYPVLCYVGSYKTLVNANSVNANRIHANSVSRKFDVEFDVQCVRWIPKASGSVRNPKLRHIYYYVQYSRREKNFFCILSRKLLKSELYYIDKIRNQFEQDVDDAVQLESLTRFDSRFDSI